MIRSRKAKGFTLVEVVLAIGLVASSFLAVFALLPVGIQGFHRAMDTSVSAEIAQRIASDLEQTDFNRLIANPASGSYYVLPMRYFDDQGTEVTPADPVALSPAERAKILYWVRVRGSLPGSPDPASHNTAYFTSLPSSRNQRFNPRGDTFLAVQIANNPGGIDLNGMIDSADLVDDIKAQAANLMLQTYPVLISRNGY